MGSLFYPLQEGFEVSLTDITFSGGGGLKINYFFLFIFLFFFSRLHYFPAGAIYVEVALNISYLLKIVLT